MAAIGAAATLVGLGAAAGAVKVARLVRAGQSAARTATKVGRAAAAAPAQIARKPAPNSGIYIVMTKKGGVYVGQSGNIDRRLAQHIARGKFTKAEADNAARWGVKGGKTQREIAEQHMIDRLGGIKNLMNTVNPIGPKRFHLMPPGYKR